MIKYLILIVLPFAYYLKENDIFVYLHKISKNLSGRKLFVVGIMSARENFLKRETIRNTWAKLIDWKFGEIKFLVGRDFCGIPEVDRITPFTCQRWTPKLSSNVHQSNKITQPMSTVEKVSCKYKNCIGFTFIVKHNISIKAFGIYSNMTYKEGNYLYKVVLYKVEGEEKMASVSFSSEISSDFSPSGFSWKYIPSIKLPFGFEGELKLLTDDPELEFECFFKLIPKGPVSIFEALTPSSVYSPNKEKCSAVTFLYDIEDVHKFQQFINDEDKRQAVWDKMNENITSALIAENKKYNDLLFLNTVDVYNKLPKKLIGFFDWVHLQDNFQYVIKTDDDVFLDISKIQDQLLIGSKWDWWSCFHVSWPPPKSGKWRDRSSTRDSYPVFPAGAGYVLTKDVADMLVNKSEFDVGEDVSVGFWLENKTLVTPGTSLCYWTCDKNCNVKPCNLADLNINQMYDVWENYMQKGKITCTP